MIETVVIQSEKVKPCPFCGWKAKVLVVGRLAGNSSEYYQAISNEWVHTELRHNQDGVEVGDPESAAYRGIYIACDNSECPLGSTRFLFMPKDWQTRVPEVTKEKAIALAWEALEQVEWDTDNTCLWCSGGYKGMIENHHDDLCERQRAVEAIAEVMEVRNGNKENQ
jgi:hypothetical protein